MHLAQGGGPALLAHNLLLPFLFCSSTSCCALLQVRDPATVNLVLGVSVLVLTFSASSAQKCSFFSPG